MEFEYPIFLNVTSETNFSYIHPQSPYCNVRGRDLSLDSHELELTPIPPSQISLCYNSATKTQWSVPPPASGVSRGHRGPLILCPPSVIRRWGTVGARIYFSDYESAFDQLNAEASCASAGMRSGGRNAPI